MASRIEVRKTYKFYIGGAFPRSESARSFEITDTQGRFLANAALAYNLGRNWRAGTRLVFYTGAPKIVESRGLLAPPPSISPERNPPFYRVDLRCEKRWNLTESAWISFIMEVMNATLSKETIGSSKIGPITIPSIGAEAGF